MVDRVRWARVLQWVQDPASAGSPPLAVVLGLGLDVAPDSVGCSVTVPSGEGFVTPAATGPLAVALDGAQYRSGQGPCIAAARDGRIHDVDMGAPPVEYGEFVSMARAHGVGSSLSWPLTTAPRPAALNLYAATPGAFTGSRPRAVAALLARAVSSVLGEARVDTTSDTGTLPADVSRVRGQRGVVLAARDAVAAAAGVSVEEAFEALARRTAQERRGLLEVARAVLAEHDRFDESDAEDGLR